MVNIYTYYENLADSKFSNQEELIELWKKSWHRKGFQAIVLGKSDVLNSLIYQDFKKCIQKYHLEIMGQEITPYGMSCYDRWCAYSTIDSEEAFYVSDYDIINNNYTHNIEYKGLSFLDGSCPCFAYGKSEDFFRFCVAIMEILKKNKSKMKKIVPELNWIKFLHDQEFLDLNFSDQLKPKLMPDYFNEEAKKFRNKYNINMSRNRPDICGPLFHESDLENKIIHFSHDSVSTFKQTKKNLTNKSCDEARVCLISSILK